jgi:hypothetical protein
MAVKRVAGVILAIVLATVATVIGGSQGAQALDAKSEAESMRLSNSSLVIHSNSEPSKKDVAYYGNGAARSTFSGVPTNLT